MRFWTSPRYQADQPPSTTTFEPVTYDDASEARKTTAPSASRASSIRPIGERAANASRNSCRLVVLHAAERERVHAHALLRPVRREIAREVEDRGLRDRVGDRLEERLAERAAELVEILRRREQPVHRRDVDDRAAAFACHRAADDLAAEERPLHVHVHHLVEGRLRVVLERADLLGGSVGRRVEPGVVDQHVRDAPLGRDDRRAHAAIEARSVTSTSYARTPSGTSPPATSKLATRMPRSASPAR